MTVPQSTFPLATDFPDAKSFPRTLARSQIALSEIVHGTVRLRKKTASIEVYGNCHECAKDKGFEVMVGLGGGSAMDGGKAVSMFLLSGSNKVGFVVLFSTGPKKIQFLVQ